MPQKKKTKPRTWKFGILPAQIVINISAPSDFAPGSDAKIEVLRLRLHHGLPLHLDKDFREYAPLFPMSRGVYSLNIPELKEKPFDLDAGIKDFSDDSVIGDST